MKDVLKDYLITWNGAYNITHKNNKSQNNLYTMVLFLKTRDYTRISNPDYVNSSGSAQSLCFHFLMAVFSPGHCHLHILSFSLIP